MGEKKADLGPMALRASLMRDFPDGAPAGGVPYPTTPADEMALAPRDAGMSLAHLLASFMTNPPPPSTYQRLQSADADREEAHWQWASQLFANVPLYDLGSRLYLFEQVLPRLMPVLVAMHDEIDRRGLLDNQAAPEAPQIHYVHDHMYASFQARRLAQRASITEPASTRQAVFHPLNWLAESLMRAHHESADEKAPWMPFIRRQTAIWQRQFESQETERLAAQEKASLQRQAVRDGVRTSDKLALEALRQAWTHFFSAMVQGVYCHQLPLTSTGLVQLVTSDLVLSPLPLTNDGLLSVRSN